VKIRLTSSWVVGFGRRLSLNNQFQYPFIVGEWEQVDRQNMRADDDSGNVGGRRSGGTNNAAFFPK